MGAASTIDKYDRNPPVIYWYYYCRRKERGGQVLDDEGRACVVVIPENVMSGKLNIVLVFKMGFRNAVDVSFQNSRAEEKITRAFLALAIPLYISIPRPRRKTFLPPSLMPE